jgi:hypothetical protein
MADESLGTTPRALAVTWHDTSMFYRHPFEAIEFEVPDAWLRSAGADGFRARRHAFAATSDSDWPTLIVDLAEVDAPRREPGVLGLHEARAISILRAMSEGVPLPPLEVHREPGRPTRLSVRQGYHRYYISIALGFAGLPVSIRPYFRFDAPVA